MKLGFIGCGNMGEAMLKGAIQGAFVQPDEIIVSTLRKESATRLIATYGVQVGSNRVVASLADIVVLAVKPNMYPTIFEQIRDVLTPETIVISITTGFTLADIMHGLDGHEKVVRTMPNTPALVGSGVTAVVFAPALSLDEKECVYAFLESFGEAIEVTEEQMVGVGSVSGSSPAFIYMFIEALADGAVKYGIPRNEAYRFAALTVAGSAKMVLETGEHPARLKDGVTSPGGTTIEGVISLEQSGFKGNVIAAMEATADKFMYELTRKK